MKRISPMAMGMGMEMAMGMVGAYGLPSTVYRLPDYHAPRLKMTTGTVRRRILRSSLSDCRCT